MMTRKILIAPFILMMAAFQPVMKVSAETPPGFNSPRELAVVKLLGIWADKGIGEPEISDTKTIGTANAQLKQVCVRFWTVRGGTETRVNVGFEFGAQRGRYLSVAPRDCASRRYSRYSELRSIMMRIHQNGENRRPFRPGGHHVVVCCKTQH